ncbi:YbaN family protein [Vibrio tapetis subsp. quintayensis]|uniref:YbaN family protein n=1 Tax=Vibrio tapetis TaxID=52443 RepID=UPI0025B4E6B8|nr:YbaN family protein [Vibrio tapetis]MDN3680446.1 YbaN family protein [Vibrio tapetis subsp. quintayensis]
MKKVLLMTLGWVATALGFIGIFVPLLPTVPFVLLAMYCFGMTSPRFMHWLETNRWFGPVVSRIRSDLGLTVREKTRILVITWLSIGLTVLFVLDNVHVQMLLVTILLMETWFILKCKTYSGPTVSQ